MHVKAVTDIKWRDFQQMDMICQYDNPKIQVVCNLL